MRRSFLVVIGCVVVAGGLVVVGEKYFASRQAVSPNSPAEQTTGNGGLVSENGSPIVGIMGAYTEDFGIIKAWGGNAAHYYKFPGDPTSISSVVAAAKSNGLRVMVSVAKINQFNNSFDLASLKGNPSRYLPEYQTVAGDPAFLGYWLVDEPCNPSKASPVQAQDFVDLYQAVKAVDARIPIVINFGYLECLQGFVNSSQPGWKLTDIAMFTITEKKLHDQPNLIAEQAAIARQVKVFDPQMKIVPQIAVLGFQDKGRSLPLPAAAWAQSTGLETAKYLNSFDGILYYSFHSYPGVKFIGASISEVQNDPGYVSAFKSVFGSAGK